MSLEVSSLFRKNGTKYYARVECISGPNIIPCAKCIIAFYAFLWAQVRLIL